MQKLPPQAAEIPLKIKAHGDIRIDEYAWLREAENPAVRAHIDAENSYADFQMRSTKKLQAQLYKEIKGRMKETDMSVPIKDGPYLYYSRTQKGKQYGIYCRRHIKTRQEEILLDENVLAKGKKFFSLGTCEVSPDHRLLAYSIDTSGDEKYRMYIKDLESGKLLSERIEAVSDVEWAEDGEHLLYTVEDHPHPPRKAFLHKLGTAVAKDELLYEEEDLQWYVALDKSRSRKYIFVISANFDSTEVRFLPAGQPTEKLRLLSARKKKVKYFPEYHNGFFYVMTNERAVNYKIMRTDEQKPERRAWREWMPHDARRALTGFLAHKDFFAITLREKGSEEI